MPKGFTGIRLLLVFVAVNTILFAMLVTSMTSSHSWLANFLPGSFATGANATGYWVFFALVLLVNAVTVLLAGFVMVLPALFASPLDPVRVGRLMERAGVPDDARDACLAAVNEEAGAARSQIAVGRAILIAGAVFLVLAFASVTITTVHALPYNQMFENDEGPVDNAHVANEQVWRFTGDQIAGALALDIPEIYDWHFSELVNSTDARLFTDFVFAFRALLGWVGLTAAMSLMRGLRFGGRKMPAAKA
ncbi:MAG TPA: hypothetical protein VMH86_17120 [Rhizomicrobium sp.]|nr:hypothetical protein [Rhizomicrobium sp.]